MAAKNKFMNAMKMPAIADMFSSEADRQRESGDLVTEVPLSELHPFVNHPFEVRDDEDMQKLVDSIKENGVLTNLTVRPRAEGGYEIISGHRRFHAAQLAGLDKIKVQVRNVDDDQAIIDMVDANIQREHISPMEKARAYAMKLEAIVTRILGKYSGAFLGCLLAGKNKKIRNNLGLALIPQAGVAIGLAAMGARTLGGAMGDALETIILASSVLYELIGPACAKLSLYLSGSYSNRLDDIVTETVKCDEHEPENEVERLIRQIQAIQKELPAHNDPFLEDEQAYDEAAYEHYALTGYPQVSYQNTRRKADIWTL